MDILGVILYLFTSIFTQCLVQGYCPDIKAYPLENKKTGNKTWELQSCVFPFQLGNQIYTKCLSIGEETPKCAVTRNYDQDHLLGTCIEPPWGAEKSDSFCYHRNCPDGCFTGNRCEVNGTTESCKCSKWNNPELCSQKEECVLSCQSKYPPGEYRSCKSCDTTLSCSGASNQGTCENNLLFDITNQKCDIADNVACNVSEKDVMSRLLCKIYLSELSPLCQYSASLHNISIFEVVLVNPMYYIDNCTMDSSKFLESLKPSHISGIRLRNDLMFHDTLFEFNSIYNKKSLALWELHNTFDNGEGFPQSNRAIDLSQYPRIFHMRYTCSAGLKPKAISMQINDTMETRGSLYVESYTGLFDSWRNGTINSVQKFIGVHDEALRVCYIVSSPQSKFYFGGPGTLFDDKYFADGVKYHLVSSDGAVAHMILPGILNNLQRIVITTHQQKQTYSLYMERGNWAKTKPIKFLMPIGVWENTNGILEIECTSKAQDSSETETTSDSQTRQGLSDATSGSQNRSGLSNLTVIIVAVVCTVATAVIIVIGVVCSYRRSKRGRKDIDDSKAKSNETAEQGNSEYSKEAAVHLTGKQDFLPSDAYSTVTEKGKELDEMTDTMVYHDISSEEMDGRSGCLMDVGNEKVCMKVEGESNDTREVCLNDNTSGIEGIQYPHAQMVDNDVYEGVGPMDQSIQRQPEPNRESAVEMVENTIYGQQ